MNTRALLVVLLTLAFTSQALRAASFDLVKAAVSSGSPVATLRALSTDGTTVVGTSATFDGGGSPAAYRWGNGTRTLLSPLPGPSRTACEAHAVSANGAVIVGSSSTEGTSTSTGKPQAVRWINGAITPTALGLPADWTTSTAHAVSDDGSVIVGRIRKTIASFKITAAFRWTAATGTVVLDMPPPPGEGISLNVGDTESLSSAFGMLSRDGNIFVGNVHTGGDETIRPYRWVATGAPEALEVPPGATSVVARSLTNDGQTVVGSVTLDGIATACRWDGTALTLLPPLGAPIGSSAAAISADGTVIVGANSAGEAIRWTGGGAEKLGDFTALAVSADGAIVAGLRSRMGWVEAVVWDEFNGVRSLTTLLLRSFTDRDIGLYNFSGVVGVRHLDGKITLAGTARQPAHPTRSLGITDGWFATLEAPSGVEPNPFAGPLLDSTPGFNPSFSFTETLKHSLASDGALTRFTTAFTATIPLKGVDLTTLNADTRVEMVFGRIAVSKKLGDDPSYAPAKTSAQFGIRAGETGDGAILQVAWFNEKLILSVRNLLAETPGGFFRFDGLRTVAFAVPPYIGRTLTGTGYFDLDLRFGDLRGSKPVFISLNSSRQIVDRKEFGSTFRYYLSDVRVTGSLDTKAPTVKIVTPLGKAVVLAPTLSVAVAPKDNALVTRVLVRVNGGSFVDAHLAAPTNTIWRETVTLIPGANTIETKAIDFNGNESAVVTTTVSYLPKTGIYTGLLTGGDGAPRGIFTLKLTEAGGFTGKAKLDGKALSFRGTLAPDSTAQVVIGKDAAAVTFEFAVAFDGAANVLTGTLRRGQTLLAQIDAARLLYDGKSTFSPWQGAYTLLFPPTGAAETPPGFGYATLTVAANGGAKIAGKLADGTAFSAGTAVDGRDAMPLSIKLYRNGILAGSLLFRDRPGVSDLDGILHWQKPAQTGGFFKAAFTSNPAVIGSDLGLLEYSRIGPTDPQQTGINARLRFSGGDLVAPLQLAVFAHEYGIFPAAGQLTVKSTIGGLFSGTFLDPTANKVRKFQGAIFAKTQDAAGLFLGTETGGRVEMLPGYQ